VEHRSAGDITWEPAPTEFFDGKAWFGPMGEPKAANGLLTLGVLFEPGARTHWHHHPDGQTLYIVSGAGHVEKDDGERIDVSAGDVVSVPPGEVHWHGASEGSYMMHLSLTTGGQTIWETGEVGYISDRS
jgi:quercetin dioxygenase-like cupin family protein